MVNDMFAPDFEEIEKKPDVADSIFQQLSSIVPERDDIEDEDFEDVDVHKTLTERMAESPNLSDTQTIVKEMFPRSGIGWLDGMLVSRIFPDIYNSLSRIISKHMMQDDDDMSVTEAIVRTNTSMSIPIDGESRIELVALAGAIKETEIEKERNKLGMP